MVNLKRRIEKSAKILCFWRFLYNKRVANRRFYMKKPTQLIIGRLDAIRQRWQRRD
jgi:hypothetical protein